MYKLILGAVVLFVGYEALVWAVNRYDRMEPSKNDLYEEARKERIRKLALQGDTE